MILTSIERSQQKHLFEKEVFCIIINVFTDTFLNKTMNCFPIYIYI